MFNFIKNIVIINLIFFHFSLHAMENLKKLSLYLQCFAKDNSSQIILIENSDLLLASSDTLRKLLPNCKEYTADSFEELIAKNPLISKTTLPMPVLIHFRGLKTQEEGLILSLKIPLEIGIELNNYLYNIIDSACIASSQLYNLLKFLNFSIENVIKVKFFTLNDILGTSMQDLIPQWEMQQKNHFHFFSNSCSFNDIFKIYSDNQIFKDDYKPKQSNIFVFYDRLNQSYRPRRLKENNIDRPIKSIYEQSKLKPNKFCLLMIPEINLGKDEYLLWLKLDFIDKQIEKPSKKIVLSSLEKGKSRIIFDYLIVNKDLPLENYKETINTKASFFMKKSVEAHFIFEENTNTKDKLNCFYPLDLAKTIEKNSLIEGDILLCIFFD